MDNAESIRRKYRDLSPSLNERQKRLWAGSEAIALGYGGIKIVTQATGLAINTVTKGISEISNKETLDPSRVRRSGGGRKAKAVLVPDLAKVLEELVESGTRGDPESPIRWTSKSTRHLSKELKSRGFRASHTLVSSLLREAGYSLQSNVKTKEGTNHPDRNAQFEHISDVVKMRLRRSEPCISVDTKKKEIIGPFKNGGREWAPMGKPVKVKVHDFPDPKKGKAVPYGVYDIGQNAGWVSVGVDHDTAEFAVATIRKWWRSQGAKLYPRTKTLLITADSGGSNGSRVRLWKWELQKLATQTGLTISVCHLPPGTSKWNKIEHRLFSFISKNWRGVPLLTHATVVSLIAATTTTTGLKVRCILDTRKYAKCLTPTTEQMASLKLKLNKFHGDWNYTISPR